MAKINWTDEAQQWLEDSIAIYQPTTPRRQTVQFREFMAKYSYYKTFPKLVSHIQQLPDRNVRILLYGHYRIPYLIKPNQEIDILGVFHGALDISNDLFKLPEVQ